MEGSVARYILNGANKVNTAKAVSALSEMTKAEDDAQKIRRLEVALKQARDDLQEYITAEKVMIAAGKVSEATVAQAHELVRNLK